MCYHTLGPDTGGPDAWTALKVSDFRAQLAELRKCYDIMPLDEALLSRGERPRAALTFDDGDIGLYTHLLPILRDDPVPVTIYVASAQIEKQKPYWFDRVMNACKGPDRLEVGLGDLGSWVLDGMGEPRWRVQSDLLNRLKAIEPSRREEAVDQIADLASDPPEPRLGPMTVDQLKELAALPYVTIGGHSHCHNLLDQIPLDQVRDSVIRNRALLETWTGREIRHFAYPNGNHNAGIRALIAELGFASATVLDNALAYPGADPYALSRIAIGRYDGLERLRLRLAGL